MLGRTLISHLVRLAFIVLLAALPHFAAQAAPPLPADQKAIFDTLRARVAEDIGHPVDFTIRRADVIGEWAFVDVTPQRHNAPVDWTKTKFAKAFAADEMTDIVMALLRRQAGGAWVLAEFAFGPTDVPWEPWMRKYNLPRGLFDPGASPPIVANHAAPPQPPSQSQSSNIASSVPQTFESCPSSGSPEVKVFDNGNLFGVLNQPTAPTIFSIAAPTCISSIITYHYNGGRGATAGQIAVRDATGHMFGPWPVSAHATADVHQGPVKSGPYWLASPQIVLPPGTYTIVDSDQATWSHNAQNGMHGMAQLFAKPVVRTATAVTPPNQQPSSNAATTTAIATPPSTQPPSKNQQGETTEGQPNAHTATASIAKPQNPLRVLKPFTGYKDQDTCDAANYKLQGAPWRDDDGKSGPPELPLLARYQALLRHTMQGLRLFYGPMTPVEDRSFNAFWAPFFDHPTSAALDYFEKVTPLLDEMVVTLNTLDGAVPGFGQTLQDALITDADTHSGAVLLSASLYQQVKTERAKLDDLQKKIEALGNPPNPLAAKCHARKRHHDAVGTTPKKTTPPTGSLFDQLASMRPWHIDISAVTGGQMYTVSSNTGGLEYPHVPSYHRTVIGDVIVFETVEAGFGEANCGMMTRQDTGAQVDWKRHRIEFHFDPTHGRILDLVAREELQSCAFNKIGSESKVPGVISGKSWLELSSARTYVWSEIHARDLPVDRFQPRPLGPSIRNQFLFRDQDCDTNDCQMINDFGSHVIAVHGEELRRSGNMDREIRISYLQNRPDLPLEYSYGTPLGPETKEWMGWQTSDRKRADGTSLWVWLTKQAALPKVFDSTLQSQQSANNGPSSDQSGNQFANDAAVKAEAIADHLALVGQIRKDAERWATDAGSETNKERKAELLKRAQEMRANAQSEQDITDGLRTGSIIHTPTEWDEAQHQELITNIKSELATFDLENKILANIPTVADMLTGAQGDIDRETLNKQVSEAILSPDAVKRLSVVYGDLKNKVVEQGVRQMATEQENIALWDQRVQIAEDVEATAGAAIMLGTLWNPVELGSLAIGYAGATGFAEDGIKGGAKAVLRSVSSKADAVISAYEGAVRIDPATGQPGGVWGAIAGALWSIGTNAVMEVAGEEIRQARAEYAFRLEANAPTELNPRYALEAQAKGGPGVKPVARATREARLKEFDFKTPEERFHEELAEAKTPADQAAVRKKHAILVEREAMKQEMDTALQTAEEAVHNGTDPAEAKSKYESDLAAINEKYKSRETRNKEHQEVMKELGFDQNYDKTNSDMRPTGSNPESAASDMDLTPQGTPHEAYQKAKRYVEAMQKPGRDHNIIEYGDRWVDTTSDVTIWKPGFGADKPGSSSFEAEAIFGTLPHSDKFGTKSGIEWTSTGKTDDPIGAVLANTGKAVGAGMDGNHPIDLHTIGKSASKAASAAGLEVEPGLKQQIEALQKHQTPEQAGVLTLGADKATKDKEAKAFMKKVEALLAAAYRKAKTTSEGNIEVLEKQADAKGTSNEAYALRARIKGYLAGDQAALTTIAKVAPDLVARWAPVVPEASVNRFVNFGGLAKSLTQEGEDARTAPPLSSDGGDKTLADLKDRCKDAAQRVEAKRAAAKPGSDEARYLADLKAVLTQGATNPTDAIRGVRMLSGFELSAVLAQLGVPPSTKH